MKNLAIIAMMFVLCSGRATKQTKLQFIGETPMVAQQWIYKLDFRGSCKPMAFVVDGDGNPWKDGNEVTQCCGGYNGVSASKGYFTCLKSDGTVDSALEQSLAETLNL